MSAFDVLQSTREKVGQSESRLTTADGACTSSAPALIQTRQMPLKRVMDVVLAALLFLLLMLPMALFAALIKLTSPGPAFFSQWRVGQNGRLFKVYKFRTMFAAAESQVEKLQHLNEASQPLFKIRNDPRLTPVGRFLRRLSFDELPQLWNVLCGDMSLVGPRPALPSEVAHYAEWHQRRLEVPQGATGLWQVSGRSDLAFDEMVRLDLYYIEHWSAWLDLQIIVKTIPAMLTGRGAY